MNISLKAKILMICGVIIALAGSIGAGFIDLFMPEFIAFAGAVILVYAFVLHWMQGGAKWAKILMYVIHAGLILVAVSFVAVQVFILVNDATTTDYSEKYVIALGAGLVDDRPTAVLQSRMNAVKDYMEKNPEAIAIVCGGQGKNETISEAEAYYRYLIGENIPEERIIIEDRSRNTAQNLSNAAEIIEIREGSLHNVSCVVVTNDFHMWRSLFYGEKYGLSANGLAVATPGIYSNIECRLREYFSMLKALCGMDMYLGFQ